jgi:hypothetical protein
MKIWRGYGSEHSMNLVIIGEFRDATTAADIERLMNELIDLAVAEEQNGTLRDAESRWFTGALREFMEQKSIYTLGPSDVEELIYDHSISRENNSIVVRTDESEVLSLIKLMLHGGARIKLYSAHDHPTGF